MGILKLVCLMTFATATLGCTWKSTCVDCLKSSDCVFILIKDDYGCVTKSKMHTHSPRRSYRLKYACAKFNENLFKTRTASQPSGLDVTTEKPAAKSTFLFPALTTPVPSPPESVTTFEPGLTRTPKIISEATPIPQTTEAYTTRALNDLDKTSFTNGATWRVGEGKPKDGNFSSTRPTSSTGDTPEQPQSKTRLTDERTSLKTEIQSPHSEIIPPKPWSCPTLCTESLKQKLQRSMCRSHSLVQRYVKKSENQNEQDSALIEWDKNNPSRNAIENCMFLISQRRNCCKKINK